MPGEWARHSATWLAWPHHEPDWPGKLAAIQWVYAEIVRVLHRHERVEILCHNEDVYVNAQTRLDAHGCKPDQYRLHLVPTDRVWLRDSAPIGVVDESGAALWLDWGFNAWAKYPNWQLDANIGPVIARLSERPREVPLRPDTREPIVLEGGGIDVNGQGLLLVG